MITLEQAREHIGELVVYGRHMGLAEQGAITSVNEHYVFVRYGSQVHSSATYPRDLEPLVRWDE